MRIIENICDFCGSTFRDEVPLKNLPQKHLHLLRTGEACYECFIKAEDLLRVSSLPTKEGEVK